MRSRLSLEPAVNDNNNNNNNNNNDNDNNNYSSSSSSSNNSNSNNNNSSNNNKYDNNTYHWFNRKNLANPDVDPGITRRCCCQHEACHFGDADIGTCLKLIAWPIHARPVRIARIRIARNYSGAGSPSHADGNRR